MKRLKVQSHAVKKQTIEDLALATRQGQPAIAMIMTKAKGQGVYLDYWF